MTWYLAYTEERWETVGRCDEDELCNGITAVQYMVGSTKYFKYLVRYCDTSRPVDHWTVVK